MAGVPRTRRPFRAATGHRGTPPAPGRGRALRTARSGHRAQSPGATLAASRPDLRLAFLDLSQDFGAARLIPLRAHHDPLVLDLSPAARELLAATPLGPALAHDREPWRGQTRRGALGFVFDVDLGQRSIERGREVLQHELALGSARQLD